MDLFKLAATITMNDEGFKKGVRAAEQSSKNIRSDVMKLAHEYKRSGMSMGDSMKKAWDTIEEREKEAYLKSHGTLDGYVSVHDQANKKVKGSAIDAFGTVKKVAAVAFSAVGAGATFAAKKGMDFEAQMSKVGAISGASASDLQKLTDKAKEMGIKTKFSATEAGQAFEYMAMAGWKTGDMMNGVSGIMNLAAASGEDLGTTADIVTDALTAFGMSAKDSGEFADVLAQASSNANTNVGLMGETFKYVAPVAGSLGYSAKDTAIAIGLMANSGIKASQAGTSLRAGLTNLVNPTDKIKASMDKYGISIKDSHGKMKSFRQVMVDLRNKLGGLDKATQAATVSQIFGKEAMSGWLAIINASPQDFDKLTNSIDNSSGAAQKMADKMNDNLKGQLTLLMSSLESMGIAFYEKFKKPLTEAVKGITDALNVLVSKLNNGDLDNAIQTIGLLASTLGTTLVVIKGYNKVMGIVEAFKAWKKATEGLTLAQKILNITMVSNPLGLIIALIAGLVAGFIYLWNTSEGFRNFWIGMWEGIKEAVGAAWEGIKGFFNETIPNTLESVKNWAVNIKDNVADWVSNTKDKIGNWAKSTKDSIKNWASENWEKTKGFFSKTKEGFGEFVEKSKPHVKNFLLIMQDGMMKWKEMLTNFPEYAKKKIFGFFEAVKTKIKMMPIHMKNLGEKIGFIVVDTILNVKDAIVNFFTVDIPSAWDSFTSFITQKTNELVEWFTELPGRIANGITAFVAFAGQVKTQFLTWLNEVWTDFTTWGANLWESAKQISINTFNSLMEWFRALPGRIWNKLVEAYNFVTNWGSNLWNKAKEIGGGFLNSVIERIRQLPGQIWNLLVSAYNRVRTWGHNLANKARDIGRTFKEWLINTIRDLPSQMANIGRDIVRGVWNGIKNMGSWLISNVKGFFGGILKGAKEAMDIHSPSRVMRDQVGKYMAMGVGVGFTDQMDKVNKEIQNSIAIPNVPTLASLREDSRREDHSNLIGAIMSLANRPAKFEIDGREVMIALAPHQDEFTEYNKIHNVSWA